MDSERGPKSKRDDDRRHTFHRQSSHRRQDSWAEFKGRAFKMASTVILPRNRRITLAGDASSAKLQEQSTSSKSLPQIKREEIKMPEYIRSISVPSKQKLKVGSSPEFQTRRVLFAPQSKSVDEDEELDLSEAPSTTSSRSSTAECLIAELDDDSRIPISRTNVYDINLDFMSRLSTETRSLRSNELLMQQLRHLKERPGADEVKQFKDCVKGASIHSEEPPGGGEDSGNEQGECFEDYHEDLAYHDFYSCMPPPVFMLCITVAEIGFFVYHAKRLVNDPNYGYISKFTPAPLDSVLIYNPARRNEIWRYLTYAFVHSGYMHLINNIVVQLILGILLEMVHQWRVLAIYFAGILAGSLATSIAQPYNYLAGASAGVYALIAAHLSTVILNWTEMEHPWIRILVFMAFVVHDGGTAIYFRYVVGQTTNVGYAAHLGGAIAGLLVGIHVLKNLQWRKWEEVLWWFCVVACALLLTFAVAWNIFRTDLFP